MKINVIGLWYIGLPTALIMAANGLDVIGTDYNKDLVNTLNSGKVTFEEKGLQELFDEALNKNIEFTTEYENTDMYIVAVPTPYDKFSKKVDVGYVCKAVETVMSSCKKGAIVVIESTVSPGTIDKYVRPNVPYFIYYLSFIISYFVLSFAPYTFLLIVEIIKNKIQRSDRDEFKEA